MNQNEEKAKICGLCLESCYDNFDGVDNIKAYMLEILQLKLEPSQSDEELICKYCTGNLKICFDLKMAYLYTEDCINSFSAQNKFELDLTEVYLKENQVVNKDTLPEDYAICRFCLKLVNNSCALLSDETKDLILLKILLNRHFPKLDLKDIQNLAVCTSCRSSLHIFVNFMRKLNDQEIVTNECRDKDSRITLKDTLKWEIDDIDFNGSKIVKEEFEKVDIKTENIEFEGYQQNTIQCQSEVSPLSFKIKTEEADIVDQIEPRSYTTNHENQHGDHVLDHQNVADPSFYHCEICKFKTKYLRNLKQHLSVHKDWANLKCDNCDFRTEQKSHLTRHKQVHRDVSEATLYYCNECSFQTIHKRSLVSHCRSHNGLSEVRTYQCTYCDFKTKHRGSMSEHVLVHQVPSDVEGYLCEICGVKLMLKSDFKRHTSSHQLVARKTTFKCKNCEYESENKGCLTEHAKIHGVSPKERKYPCKLCSYKAVHMCKLKRHMLIHKEVSEVTHYQCCSCEYKTKYKNNLEKHMLRHTDASELTMYRCDVCSYDFKRKQNLNLHIKRKHRLKVESSCEDN